MNSLQFSTKFFALALVFALSSCASDQVDPSNSQSLYENGPTLAGDAGDHTVVAPECSPRVVYPLMDESGGMDINYFGSSGNSGGGMTQWGSATLLNSDQEFVIEIDLATGWYVERTDVFVGNEAEIITQNGIPQVEETWLQADVNPLVNATQLRVDLPSGPEDCFNLVVGLSLVQYDAAVGIDENSRTQVWLSNTLWDDSSQPELNTISFAVAKWCVVACGN